MANALENLGRCAIAVGDTSTAVEQYRESLELFRELEDPRGLAGALEGIAAVAMERGR